MAIRIAGVMLDEHKRAEIGLTKIFGIGKTRSNVILERCGINRDTKIKDFTEENVSALRKIIEKEFSVEGDLRREVVSSIQRLKQIKCFRGLRHTNNLPCRGQRTKTNGRTVRGNKRKTMGSGKKGAPAHT